jgi:DegV family protein with EDD domain
MQRRAVLVSDSTSVDVEMAKRLDVQVVPLQVVIGTTSYDEGDPGASPEQVAEALRGKQQVSTSRPPPARFREVYQEAVDGGADAVVSVHLSSEVSGTFESALLAARDFPGVDIEVVDSRHLGMGTGFAVASAAAVLDDGGSAAEAAEAARQRAAVTRGLFYVDTLEYLRRGGRVGMAAALVGSALAVKPLLQVQDGRIVPLDKVRTKSKAIARLEELALEAAGDAPVDVAVSHLANAERAEVLLDRLRDRLTAAETLEITEVGPVLGAHVGPGLLAVVVAPRP